MTHNIFFKRCFIYGLFFLGDALRWPHRVIKDSVPRARVAFWKLVFTFLLTPSSLKPIKM